MSRTALFPAQLDEIQCSSWSLVGRVERLLDEIEERMIERRPRRGRATTPSTDTSGTPTSSITPPSAPMPGADGGK